jgi:hypothetical protein
VISRDVHCSFQQVISSLQICAGKTELLVNQDAARPSFYVSLSPRLLVAWIQVLTHLQVPTYMAEMSITSKERGPEVAIQCIWLISGVALAYCE